jgi:hypothetical protein
MTEAEAVAELERLDREEGPLGEADQRHLENLLTLHAYVRGWTGDPLAQPATAVLAAYRQMRREKTD